MVCLRFKPRMVGADKSTEQWWPPLLPYLSIPTQTFASLKRTKVHVTWNLFRTLLYYDSTGRIDATIQ